MPDFFAPLSVLIMYILLRNINLHVLNKTVLYLLLVFSLVTHFTHLLLSLLLITGIISLKLAFKERFKDLSLRKIINVTIIIVASWLLIPSMNYIVEREFYFSKGNHAFLMAHLTDTGILEKFLDDKCDEEEYRNCRLCNYKDSLPTDLASFLWSGEILDSTGGWVGSKEKYNRIIYAILKEPKYLFLNIYKSFTYGLVHLTKNRIGQGLSSYTEGSPPYGQIHWEFHHELNNYLNSRQISLKGAHLKLDALNAAHFYILIFSLFLMIFLFTTPIILKTDQDSVRFFDLYNPGSHPEFIYYCRINISLRPIPGTCYLAGTACMDSFNY